MDTINKRINYIRNEAKLRKNKFASEIGISPSYITQIELGKKSPSDPVIKVICFRFNVNEDWLINVIGDIHYEPPKINDIKPMTVEQLKALAAKAPKDRKPVEEELITSSGLSLSEQVDVLKENRTLRLQIQQLSDYLKSIDRGPDERRKCIGDIKKIISIEEYRGLERNQKDINRG
jgi:transcriptional regulator with XRE-family HTH domain